MHTDTNYRYHRVISKFKDKTGIPLIVNTSFNVRGETIVCTTTDAFKCFMVTELDLLAIGNFLMIKEDQKENLKANYKESYELD